MTDAVEKKIRAALRRVWPDASTVEKAQIRTLGGGLNEPGATRNTFSAVASACTFTDSAPYSFEPAVAVRRSATSRWTR